MTPILRLLLAAFLAVVAGSCVEAAEVSFNQGWRFHRVDGGGTPERPPAGAAWSIVSLPHTPRLEPRIVNDQWQGTAFYEKILRVPPNWRGKTVLLRVEAAMNLASVRVDGRHVADHLGGYLPFTIDLTPHLRLGDESRIEIRLDNRDNPITGPKPLKDLDFNTYGGLYRGGRAVARDAVETPSQPRSLRLALDTADVPPVAGDILFVRATVVDRHGRRVGTPPVVLFSACGDYELIGDRSVAAEAGIASALVRVRHARAKGGISARSAGLEAGRLQENCPTPR